MAPPWLTEAPGSNNPSRSVSGAEEFGSDVSRALIVFARLPVPGKVKTRLAAGVGTEAACEFYKACAEHIIQEAGRYEEGLRLFFTLLVLPLPVVSHILVSDSLHARCRCPGVQAYLFYSDAADEARIGAWLKCIGERETFLLAPQVRNQPTTHRNLCPDTAIGDV